MTALLPHLRAEARRRRAAWVAVVVLVAVVGGLVLGALAGARRTHTAFDRLVAATDTWDLLINPDQGADSAVTPDAVRTVPGIAEVGALEGVAAVLVGDEPPALGSGPLVLAAGDERVLVAHSRPRVVEGALYDPTDPTAAMVDDVAAREHGIGAGDRIQVATGETGALLAWEAAGGVGEPPLETRDVTVAAVVAPADGIVQDEAFVYGTVYLSPAFAAAHDLTPFYRAILTTLEPGTTPGSVRAAVRELAPDEAVEFRTIDAIRDTVGRGVLPHTIALLAFATVVGAAGIVAAAQATAHQLEPLRADARTLRAVGFDHVALRRAAYLRVGLLVCAGVALALALSVAASPLFPVGVAARAEVDPGFDVDLRVLLPGAALLALALVASCRGPIREMGRPGSPLPVRGGPGRLERAVATISAPVAATGLRAAVGRRGSPGRTVRGATLGLAAAVASVAATVTFGASVDHLLRTPAEYGWAWDAHVTLPSQEWNTPAEEIVDRAEEIPELDGWSIISVDQVDLGGERVPAVGIEYRRGQVGPEILRGRAPRAPDEVALGGRTMDLLDVELGDRMTGGRADDARPLTVVGQAVFPGLGTYPGADRTELGKGALLDRGALAELGEGFGFESLVLLTGGEARLDAALEQLVGDQQAAIDAEEIEVFRSPARPADVLSLERVRATPLLIAAVLSVLGGAALAFVLVSGVRGRRRELALLKTFGFRRRDVAGTIAYQATATALAACAVGVPLGAVTGRLGWSVLAEVLGVDGQGRLPAALLVVVPACVVLANLIAVVPGVVAAQTRAAAMLRAE